MEGWSVRYSRQSQQDKKQPDVPCFHLVILVYKIQTSLPLIWEWLFLKFRVRCFPCSCSNLLGVFWLDCVWSCCPPRFCFLAPRDWWFRISPVGPDPNRCAKGDYEFEQALPLRCWVAHRKGEPWVMGLVSHRSYPCSYSSFKLFWYIGIFFGLMLANVRVRTDWMAAQAWYNYCSPFQGASCSL